MASAHYDKDAVRLLDSVKRAGWRVERTPANHFKIYPPGGSGRPITTSCACRHSLLRDLRRAGFAS